jgi:anaerobic ribonucleoside-triphosphate reductase
MEDELVLDTCKKCGATKRRHFACQECGWYGDKKIFDITQKKNAPAQEIEA